VAKLPQPNSLFLFLGGDGARGFSVGAHKADEEANKLANHKDPLHHAKVISADFADVGNDVPGLSYKAGS
jgi:hypothetical protein